MSLQNKALLLGGAGIVASVTYGLVQPKSSPTVREQLGYEGYELISEKEKVDEIWKNRATLYKTEYEKLSLYGLGNEDIENNPNKLKNRCEEYKNKKIRVKDIGEETYKKVTVLCTLNIGEYINLYLNGDEKVISDSDEEGWKDNLRKYDEEIEKKFKETTMNKAKEVLSKFCTEAFKKQHSNENKEDKIKANLWCVKRPSEPEIDIGFWYWI